MISSGVTGVFRVGYGIKIRLSVWVTGPPGLIEALEEVFSEGLTDEDNKEREDMPQRLQWIYDEVVNITKPDLSRFPPHVRVLMPDKVWNHRETCETDVEFTLPFDPVKYREHYAKMGFLIGPMVKSASKQ